MGLSPRFMSSGIVVFINWIYLALLVWERILCIVYKVNLDPHSDYITTHTLFLPSEQKNQVSKNLQKLSNPVKTIKMWRYANGRGCHIDANVCVIIFLNEHLVHKLLTIVTKFPVLLKISVVQKLYLGCA